MERSSLITRFRFRSVVKKKRKKILVSKRELSYSSSNKEIISKNNGKINGGVTDKIPDWFRSSELWSEQPMPATDSVKKPIAVNATKTGGSFHPFKKEKAASAIPTSSTSNDNLNGGGQSSGSHIEEKVKEKTDGSSYRKESRCWSPELHKRFLNIAFQDLCGSQIATPKQIRELLKVGGLTNDEVKSHLQKYCLHNRKPTNSTVEASLNDPHQPDILLLSGKFVPPSNCTGSATTANADTKIYAPVASLPSQAKQQQQTILKYNTSPTSPLVSMVLFQNRDANGGYGCKVTNSGSSGTSSSTSTI